MPKVATPEDFARVFGPVSSSNAEALGNIVCLDGIEDGIEDGASEAVLEGAREGAGLGSFDEIEDGDEDGVALKWELG